jgi:hypothetical protein
MTTFHCLPLAKNCPCEGRWVGGAESKVRPGRQFLGFGLSVRCVLQTQTKTELRAVVLSVWWLQIQRKAEIQKSIY